MDPYPRGEPATNGQASTPRRDVDLCALLKQLERVYHAGMRGEPDQAEVRIAELEDMVEGLKARARRAEEKLARVTQAMRDGLA